MKPNSILIIDNYDSFTYNLVHYAEQCVDNVTVVRNDKISVSEVMKFDAVIISPGPGLPADAGITIEVIREFGKVKPVLGICLGHQAIGEAFGAKLYNLDKVLHGVALPVNVTDKNEPLFRDLPERFLTGRYHSWVIDKNTLPEELLVTAVDDDGIPMAVRHKSLNICGVQFHPESILTENGFRIIKNWVEEE